VRRLALVIIVSVLSFSATGVARLLIGEPCTAFTLAAEDDGDCPPTCVTCGCCAQAAETASMVVAGSLDISIPHVTAVLPGFTDTDPRDILHVPKLRSV
jgi:hypothetical protein